MAVFRQLRGHTGARLRRNSAVPSTDTTGEGYCLCLISRGGGHFTGTSTLRPRCGFLAQCAASMKLKDVYPAMSECALW